MHRLWNEVIAEAKQAEQHGFDAFQPSEHHQQETGYWPSLLTVLAGVAAETETIELGTSLFLLPLYHPVQVAEKVAMVDIVSDGRMGGVHRRCWLRRGRLRGVRYPTG